MASRVRRTPPARRARPRARTASASPRVFGKAGSTTKKASGAVEPILPTSPSFCCIPERHPPLEHHSAGTRHGEQVAVPGRLGRVAGQRAMPAMITNELFNVGEESHRITSSARNSTDDEIVSPSCNVVGCSTGTSAGFAPLRTLFPGTAALGSNWIPSIASEFIPWPPRVGWASQRSAQRSTIKVACVHFCLVPVRIEDKQRPAFERLLTVDRSARPML